MEDTLDYIIGDHIFYISASVDANKLYAIAVEHHNCITHTCEVISTASDLTESACRKKLLNIRSMLHSYLHMNKIPIYSQPKEKEPEPTPEPKKQKKKKKYMM